MTTGAAVWADALIAARLLAAAPQRLAGIRLRARPGPVRDAWLEFLSSQVAGRYPVRKLPGSITPDRLIGGIDLSATLSAGRPVALQGLLSEADMGMVIVPMAERMPPHLSAALLAALDTGRVSVQRDGLSDNYAARFGVVLLDEGEVGEDEPPSAMLDRLALSCSLEGLSIRDIASLPQEELPGETVDDPVGLLCTVCQVFGIGSARAPLLALKVAQESRLLRGDGEGISSVDIERAIRLSLLHRATRLPEVDPEQSPEAEPESTQEEDRAEVDGGDVGRLADRVVESVLATLPPDVLAGLEQAAARGRSATAGRGAGGIRRSLTRGRPIAARAGRPNSGARLHLVETLRAAAPWQSLRTGPNRVKIRGDDFRIRRYAERSEATLVFVVDASGSAAAERLAETKGAVELLLAEAYVKRTQVALVAFRGSAAELVLAPTRSLVRAKKCLADLVGGGGTPLAAGLEAGQLVAEAARDRGRTPFIVLMTDGRANVARDGSGERASASEDARQAASRLGVSGIRGVVIDIAARPRDDARAIAVAMKADYAALPTVNAAATRRIVSALAP